MENEALKARILGLAPEAELIENNQILTFHVPAPAMRRLAASLKSEPDLAFDYLFNLTAVDMVKYLEVVYHLESITHRHLLSLKVRTEDRENGAVDSVCDIWRTAEFHEREAWDLMGIRFNNHPDLRRLFLEEGWKGHPLRKDYKDEVNIVEL